MVLRLYGRADTTHHTTPTTRYGRHRLSFPYSFLALFSFVPSIACSGVCHDKFARRAHLQQHSRAKHTAGGGGGGGGKRKKTSPASHASRNRGSGGGGGGGGGR